jgi:transposase
MMRKKINGKKRDILVDALGLLLHAIVHPADIQDRDGGILLLATLLGMYPFLKKLLPTAAIRGPEFHKALAKILPHLETEIVKRSDRAEGFVVLPRRWRRRTDDCVAQPLPTARKGLGKPQSQGAGVPAPCINPPHASKTLQSRLMFPDRLQAEYAC